MQTKWILCPVCGNKTRLQIRADTALKAGQGICFVYDLVGFIPLEEPAKEETA